MDELIENLLTVARDGDTDPELTHISLRDSVEQCWQIVDTKEATLTVETDQRILADQRQLHRLLENLMSNTVDHGGDTVTITVGDLANGFYFEDDGRGLPNTTLETRTEYGFSTEATGTGLGLSNVDQIIENHEWNLSVTETETSGTRFESRDIR